MNLFQFNDFLFKGDENHSSGCWLSMCILKKWW